MRPTGFEPAPCELKVRCSAIKLWTRNIEFSYFTFSFHDHLFLSYYP